MTQFRIFVTTMASYSNDNALDGVPFRLDPRLQAVSNYDFSRVNEILSRPLPTDGLSNMCDNLLSNMGALEAQVLKQLETIDNEKKAKREREEKEKEELEERRAAALSIQADQAERIELEENEANEEEELDLNNENGNDSSDPADTETEPSTASVSDPPPAVALPTVVSNVSSSSSTSIQQEIIKPNTNINFSEFEAESDPFEKAELQTLNDLQELAAVLQTTAPPTFPTSTPATFAVSSSLTTACGQAPPPSYEMVTTGAISRYPGYYQTPMQQNPFLYHQPPSQQRLFYQHQPVQQQQVLPQSNEVAGTSSSSEMKGSKSVGDIMVEIQKEAEAFEKLKIRGHQRKNSRTPPPRTSAVSDEWIPWPDIDPPKQQRVQPPQILSDLSSASQEICRQISEMGFALERVAKGCKSFGDDRQKIINYCLLVEDLVNEVGKSSAIEVEYVIPIHNLDKEVSMKHLKAFFKLEELGFNRIDIHDALVSAKLDHDKALEKLLK